MTFEQHARSFGSAVDAYEHGRPGYPAAVADWLVPSGSQRLVDVGAGTGKFTRTLLGRGAEVVAVEPDPAMRARLAALLPDVRAVDGTGEAMPLPDGSADAVTFAQSWHWVDPVAGVAEVARVLRPGGVLIFDYIRSEAEGLDTAQGLHQRGEVMRYLAENFHIRHGKLDPENSITLTVASPK